MDDSVVTLGLVTTVSVREVVVAIEDTGVTTVIEQTDGTSPD